MRARYQKLVQAVAMLLFFLATGALVSLVWPFYPFVELAYSSVPEEACVREPLKAYFEREIDAPLLGNLSYADVSGYWEDVATGDKIGNAAVTIPLAETQREEVESPVIRVAPPVPGSYVLWSEATAHGWVGFMPRRQVVEFGSPHSVEVLPADDERCA